MKIEILSTGSSGNCYRIKSGDSALLIECGLPYKKIQRLLNFKLLDLDGCLITHEHMDHAKAVKGLMKAGINCYMSKGTSEALNASGHRLKIFEKNSEDDYKITRIKEFDVLPFRAVHDVKEPVSYYIKNFKNNESMLFVTDTAYLLYKIPQVDYLMIECNYIKSELDENVKKGILNLSLRNRIVNNHLSLENLLVALNFADLNRCKRIYLLHLSDNNSNAKKIKEAVQRQTGCEVWI